ncbi:MAG: hypothetical protein HN350_19710, partial [Phycisphaerales bacterium]|nr:hypothetical protein [Phycisphaerales bacterium]
MQRLARVMAFLALVVHAGICYAQGPPDRRALVNEILNRSRLLEDAYFRIPRSVWHQFVIDESKGPDPAPVSHICSRGVYRIQADAKGAAGLDAEIRLLVLDARSAGSINVLPAPIAWSKTTLNGAPLLMAPKGKWLVFTPVKPGLYVIRARAAIKGFKSFGGSLEAPIIRTVQTEVTLDSPSDLEVTVTGAASVGRGKKVAFALKPTSKLALIYRPLRHRTERQATYKVSGAVAWNFGPAAQQVSADLRVAIIGGKTESMSISVPSGAKRVAVSGPDVRDVRISGGSVTVFFRGSISGRTNLKVDYELPAAKGVADLGRPEISSGRWSGGTLVITNTAGGSEIQPTDMSGLKELALGDIPKVASAILAGKAVWAYSITSGSWSARAESINLGEFAIKQTLADSARYQFAYRPDGSVICRADYEIRNRNRQFLRITLPVGAKVMLARVSEKSRPMTPQLGKKGEYLLPLERSTASVMGLVSFPVQLVYIYRSAPLKGARRGQVALPRIDIPIAYAWCQGHMPAEMGRAKYSGVMTPVEQYSSQTALASMTYGSATALDPKRQRLGLPQALKPAPKPGGGGGGGGGGGLFGWMFSGKSNDLAQPMVAPVKPVTTQPSGGSSSWGFSGGISTGSLTRNYWRAGKDSYEKGNYDQAAESLGKVVEIAPDSPDAPNARRLLANIKLMQGKLKAKGRAEKAAAVTVKQQISAGNAIQIEQQNVLLEEGAEAAKKGDKKLAQQKFQAAEALSQTLVAKGESITDQRARLRGAQKQLEVARRSSSEELIKGVKKLKELRQSGRIAEAGRLADQLAGNVRVLSNDGTLEVTKDFQEQREQLALESAQNRLKDKTSGGDRILVGGGLSGEQINLGGVRPNANDQKWSGRFLDNSKVVAPEAKKTVQVYKVGDLVAADITNQVNANSAALLDIDKLETQRGKRTEDLTRQINTLVKNGKVNVTLRDGQRALQVTGDYNEQHAVAALIAGLRRARGPQVQVGANIALQEGLGQTGGADYGGHNRPDASNSGAMLDIANGTNAKPRSVRASIGHQTITTNGGTVVIQPGQDDQVDPDLQKFIDNNYRWQGKKAKPGEQGEYSLGLGANAWEMENKKHAERAKIQREKIQLQQAKASLINGDRVSSGEMASTINSSRAILRYRSTMQRSKELMGKGDNLKDLQDAHKLASAAHRMLLSVSDQSDSDEYRRMLNEAERQIYWINLNITKCRNELMLGEDPKNRPKGGNDSGLFDPGAGGGGDGDLDVMRSEIPWRTLVKYPKDWKEVTGKRKPFDARQQAAFDKSFGATVSKLDFEDMELNQVIQFLRDVSGLNIHVDWRALERENIKPQTTVTISAVDISFKQALESTLKKAGTENAPELDYVVDDGVITISTKANLGQKTIVRVYDVRDMVEKVPAFEGPRMGSELESRSEALNKIKTKITDSVTRDSWYDAGGETGAISEIGGQLVVTQTRENHQKTLEAINKLRKARGLKAAFGKDKEVDELWRMEADPTLRKQLDAIVSKIELEDEKFVEAIGFLRELSGINIYVKWRALALAKLDMGSSVNVQLTNVTIRKALETVLQSVVGKDRAELDYIIDDGVLMISTKDDLELRTRIGVYDVRDIALSIQAQDGEEKSRQESLMEIRTALTDTVDRDSWREAGGETGAISEHGGQFVITHTQSGHAKILSLLNTLRSGAGLRGPVRRLWVDPTEAKVDPAVKKLLDTEVSKLDFEDMEIVQVFQFLRDVSGANIHVNWRALALESIEPATTVNVHLKKIT